jgi:hypothetical protein
VHGSGVDVFSNGFFEGCIANDNDADFTRIANVFGSGMRIQDDRYVFITPSHTLESIFIFRHKEGCGVSNSLPFLLEYNEIELPWNATYGSRFASICLGIDAYEKMLLKTSEGEVLRIAYDNVVMEPSGSCELVRKQLPPRFGTYAEYVAYLGNTLRQAFADAQREQRMMTYRPLATCSTGYDSASVAALAKRWGCQEAVTLTHARGGATDSGRQVAEVLGLRVQEFVYPECAEVSFEEVAEFLATGMGGEDYCFQPFAQVLGGRLFLTGYWGGNVRATHGRRMGAPLRSPDGVLSKTDLSGASLREFRLRQNFIHIPAPMIGARREAEVQAISHAAEMEPYRLHNDYDRPIPRRILEESGVPRAMFGQKKTAASILLFFDPHLLRGQARDEYEILARDTHIPRTTYQARSLDWRLRRWAFQTATTVARHWPFSNQEKSLTKKMTQDTGSKIGTAKRLMRQLLVGDWRVFEHSRPGAALEFCVAVGIIRKRYRVAREDNDF